ncbi:hypothetical protein D0C36_23965 [Mucilaginibacter conchicola]|uniref:Phosphoenolpyruvate synthase n=1 Tax=Mucilaginibacter conchicola TaxID=2303333 RepID=A0A372NNJ5_9SPHI|nr:PEP/pyruvate-binding domain-containing protein [Mucilaginibacter conchicola]RFZ89955.1 hypothetical protein D0C36_23965 [Mucilaginibacter conchicola]
MENYIIKFRDADLSKLTSVGYKCAMLGELQAYDHVDLLIPEGFIISGKAFRDFINFNDLENRLNITLQPLYKEVAPKYCLISAAAQQLITDARMPADMGMAIIDAYDYLGDMNDSPVSVSSSFMFEMPFDNDDEGLNTGLNVQGHCALLYAVKKSFANLFSCSALKRIKDAGIKVIDLDIAVCVQLMVRAGKGCSGLVSSEDNDFQAEDVIHISGRWGLSGGSFRLDDECDDYWIFKPSILKTAPLIELKLGRKQRILTAAPDDDYTWQTIESATPEEMQHMYVLNYHEILHLGKCALLIEKHFNSPVQFTWAKDGADHQIYILSVCKSPIKTRSSLHAKATVLNKAKHIYSDNKHSFKRKVKANVSR